MQKAEYVLSALMKKSRVAPNFVFERLYRNLFNPDFYWLAYNNIHAKEGNMTSGVDGATIDGFNVEIVEGIIADIRKESYYPRPVRRTYIPKKNGKLRPLGVPTFRDKLVQEVLRLILEAIYEPIFKDSSHGFRPHRSCHTALIQIKERGKGTNWAVEGDITGFYDNIDHDTLLNLLKKKIADGRIIELIRRFLTAGYMERHQYRNTLTGTIQGGTVSPILANIYLHELDCFAENLCKKYSTKQRTRRISLTYAHLAKLRCKAKQAGDYRKADRLLQEMRKIPSRDPMDEGFIRVHYVRYADDWLLTVIGSKALASELKTEMSTFLRDRLKLELNEEKTKITHLATQKVRFLGYDIMRGRENTKITKNTRGYGSRSVNGVLQLLIPEEIIRVCFQSIERMIYWSKA